MVRVLSKLPNFVKVIVWKSSQSKFPVHIAEFTVALKIKESFGLFSVGILSQLTLGWILGQVSKVVLNF